MKPTACVFDLNGTLLDLSVLDPHFAAAFGPDPSGGNAFGPKGARPVWFSQVVELMLSDVAGGRYSEFSVLAGAALEMVAARYDVPLAAGPAKDILAGMRSLPAFPDVAEALGRLQRSGLRLAALTQSSLESAHAQVGHARLGPYFEQVFSADTVRQLKPGPRPYAHALEGLGVAPGEAVLVAAHAWDLAGARAAGLKTAFVGRPGQALSPAAPPPDVSGATLGAVVDAFAASGYITP